jgi:hypothetical protein
MAQGSRAAGLLGALQVQQAAFLEINEDGARAAAEQA